MSTYIFRTRLVGWKGVTRTVAVRSDQTLVDLHGILQAAYGWADDHLYSFWLDGRFWGDDESEYTRPDWLEPEQRSARVKLSRLGLAAGQRIAYVFDFGDEWRVALTLAKVEPSGDGAYPRIVASRGEAPPQYPDYEDEEGLDEVA
jgi:Plasmid pRiA4b ORF-3-like protein